MNESGIEVTPVIIATLVITSDSDTNFIPLGSNVTFTCMGFNDPPGPLQNFRVVVSGMTTIFSITNGDIESLRSFSIFTSVGSISLRLLATEANNMTVVQCVDRFPLNSMQSEEMEIIVIGSHYT